MGIYDVGKTVSYYVDDYKGIVDADVLYNDGRYAVAAFEYYGEDECDEFILSADDVGVLVPAISGYVQNCFLLIDLVTGSLVKRCDWQRRNGTLYVVGKELVLNDKMLSCVVHVVTVLVEDGVAIVRVPYRSDLNEFYAQFGYEKETLRKSYPNLEDDCKDSVYMCVRIADDEILDSNGNSIEAYVQSCFYATFDGLLDSETAVRE